jgi:hypothetical protein
MPAGQASENHRRISINLRAENARYSSGAAGRGSDHADGAVENELAPATVEGEEIR